MKPCTCSCFLVPRIRTSTELIYFFLSFCFPLAKITPSVSVALSIILPTRHSYTFNNNNMRRSIVYRLILLNIWGLYRSHSASFIGHRTSMLQLIFFSSLFYSVAVCTMAFALEFRYYWLYSLVHCYAFVHNFDIRWNLYFVTMHRRTAWHNENDVFGSCLFHSVVL